MQKKYVPVQIKVVKVEKTDIAKSGSCMAKPSC